MLPVYLINPGKLSKGYVILTWTTQPGVLDAAAHMLLVKYETATSPVEILIPGKLKLLT